MINRAERRDIILKIKNGKKIDYGSIIYNFDFFEKLNLIENLSKDSINRLFKGSLPRSYSNLGIAVHPYLSHHLQNEIDWCIIRLYTFKERVLDFIRLKDEFENFLLNSKYDDCERILNLIEDNICISFWGLQAKLLIAELKANTEKNKELLEELLSKDITQNNKFFLYYTSFKYETETTTSQFDSWLDFHLKNNKTNYTKELSDYVRFKLSTGKINYDFDFQFILNQEFSNSVIDSYLNLKKIISLLIAKNDNTLQKEYIDNRASFLSNIFSDKFWVKIDSNYIIASDANGLNTKFKDAITLLFENKNKACLDLISKELQENPNNHNLFQIFTELTIYEKIEIKDYIDINTILGKVLNLMYQVCSKQSNYSERFERLKKYSYIFENFEFSLQLSNLYYSEKSPQVIDEYAVYSWLSNETSSLKDTISFINELEKLNSIETNVFFENKFKVDNLIQKGKINEALIVLNNKEFEKQLTQDKYFETWHCKKKLYCYTELNNLNAATEVVVNYYFKHYKLYDSLISNKLVRNLQDLDGEEIYKNITIPILFSIYNLSANCIYDSIANYLIQNNVSTISEIAKSKVDIDKNWFSYFLYRVCIINNIQESPFLNSIEKVEKERIKILTITKEYNPELTEEINSEIFNITQNATVRFCLQNIYDSRIFVETSGIKKELKKELPDFFTRYINISNFTFQDHQMYLREKGIDKESELKKYLTITYFSPPIPIEDFLDQSLLIEKGIKIEHENSVEVPYSRFMAFCDIFKIVKEQFVFDEDFGLKFFLSMRIRHGTLPNFLKNVFEKHSLILYESVNKDRVINFWQGKKKEMDLSFNNEFFFEELKKFTLEIEKITNEGVSWVKIKETEDDLKSMFNYFYSKEELTYIYQNKLGHIEDFEIIIEEIFETLWERTTECLIELKTKFTSELLNKYIEKIDYLQKEIELLCSDSPFIYFKDTLVSVKTDIQNAIIKTTNWFTISKTIIIGEIPISAILQTSVLYLNIINANVFSNKIIFTEEIMFSRNIKGDYFIIFCDLINTILGNVIKHTKNLIQPKCNVTIKENFDSEIIMSVKNDYNVEYDQEQIDSWSEKLNDKISNDIASFEDKSGFPKLKKILRNDLNFQDYRFEIISTSEDFTLNIVFKFKNFVI